MRIALFTLFTILASTKAACAGLVDVEMKYGSYDLYRLVMDFAARYFNTINSMLIQSGHLATLASFFLWAAFLYHGFRIYKKGFKPETLTEWGASLGIGILACIVFLNPMIVFSILQFSTKFPLQMSTFFMEALSSGAGTVMQETSLTGIHSVESLFDVLDSTLLDLIGFSMRLLPSGNILFAFAQIFIKMLLLLFLPFLFFKIYFRALIGVFLPSIWVVVSFILAPFFALIAIFPILRGYIVSLAKSVFYNWMVMIVNSLCIALVLSVATGLVSEIIQISNNNDLLANGLYIFLAIWLWLGSSLLSSVQSYVSQITEIRGTSDGGVSTIAAVATAGALMGGKAGLQSLLKKVGGAISNYLKTNGGISSFKEDQKRGISR